MKLVRYGAEGREKPGLIDMDGRVRDLSAIVDDIDGHALSPKMLAHIARARVSSLPLVRGKPRLGACVAWPVNFIGIGLNYTDHAAEIGMDLPTEPVIFQKASNCVCGANDPILMPKQAERLDWEVEVGIVIGTQAHNVSERAAMDHVAGFCLANDLSERGWQLDRGGAWTKGKSAPSFGPLGPWMVTKDEIAQPQRLGLWLDVNGERLQDGTTKNMVFTMKTIVSYVSRFFVLEPGDVIVTGTPAGVGQGMHPKRFLKAGDIVTLGADGLGEQHHEVVAIKR
ncbi:Ureidoglycolate lyase [Beijerinckiaceae bacterium RH AL1]|nr:fumarylacetoacetate hydrolase family protein [Beijerinckiaceae bacterium]VVB45582.1 Ureidoglycolate lyase [Beijerinckiaceae bacterium RH CH11]VVB45657.1 Ureidoglycolate lyase [Beijerinckiaceae bacterium RH AL8]VVC54937.1 Ureidoglycolate lyase [Beijerinckiaceae bacterium RH AL1]